MRFGKEKKNGKRKVGGDLISAEVEGERRGKQTKEEWN